MRTFWDDEDLLKIEIKRVKELYENNPIPIVKDTKPSDIKEYLNYIRNETCHGLHDSYKLLRMALEID